MGVVGSILNDGPAAFAAGAGDLDPNHLRPVQLRGLYQLLIARHERGESVLYPDVSVCPEVWSGPISHEYLREVWEAHPIVVDLLPPLVRSVGLAGIRRELEAAVQDSASESNLEDYTARLVTLAESARSAMPMTDRVNVWDEANRKITALWDGTEQPDGVATGFGLLDDMLGGGGLVPGQLTILGARPGVGKSSFARQVALHAARSGRGASIFSLEDGPFTYACRVIADGSSIPLGRLRTGKVSKEEIGQVLAICNEMKASPIDLVCIPSLTSTRIATMVRARKRSHPCDLVVIDYINLIRDPGKERRDCIDSALRTLVEMARLQNVAVVVCAQLNRNSVYDDRRPSSHDLKESGGLEQEGKAIILLHRARGSEDATLILDKNTQGDVGEIKLRFDMSTTSFRERPGMSEGSGL